jgi:hypothetical protein
VFDLSFCFLFVFLFSRGVAGLCAVLGFISFILRVLICLFVPVFILRQFLVVLVWFCVATPLVAGFICLFLFVYLSLFERREML